MPWAKQDDINTAVRPQKPSRGLVVSDKLKQSIKSIQRAIDRLQGAEPDMGNSIRQNSPESAQPIIFDQNADE